MIALCSIELLKHFIKQTVQVKMAPVWQKRRFKTSMLAVSGSNSVASVKLKMIQKVCSKNFYKTLSASFSSVMHAFNKILK